MKKRDFEFLFEIASFRNVPRAWRQHFGVDCASTLEHSFRVAFLAVLIAKEEGLQNIDKIFKMAIVHDLAETRVSDIGYLQKVYVQTDDARAVKDLFAETSFGDFEEILHEYERRDSKEAKIVKDADNLDIDVELRELEERGHKLSAKLQPMRKMVRNKKFYTKTAKKLWDALQKQNVAQWHLDANKWKKMPKAGR